MQIITNSSTTGTRVMLKTICNTSILKSWFSDMLTFQQSVLCLSICTCNAEKILNQIFKFRTWEFN